MNAHTKQPERYECVFIDSHDGTGECYQCGKTRSEHDKGQSLFDIACDTAKSVDAAIREANK
jgi:hypothetical protein